MAKSIDQMLADDQAFETEKSAKRQRPHAGVRRVTKNTKAAKAAETPVVVEATDPIIEVKAEIMSNSDETIQSVSDVIADVIADAILDIPEISTETVSEPTAESKPVTLNLDNEFNKQWVNTWNGIGSRFLDIFFDSSIPEKAKAFAGWDILMDKERDPSTKAFQIDALFQHIDSHRVRTYVDGLIVNKKGITLYTPGGEVSFTMDKSSIQLGVLPLFIETEWPELQAEIAKITGQAYQATNLIPVAEFSKILGACAIL